ncbi:MAG TPA: nucleotidyltransferase, partial [Actinomycetota bacterium]|nr:nucleotidyltransferase [Actinomycetota bacterium]
FEGEIVSEETFVRVLKEAVDALEGAEIPYGLLGGVASAVLGRPRWTHDADVFVRPADAPAALETLARAGFDTQQTNPHWLFKGIKDGVLVDVLFRARGDIYLDDEMIERLVDANFHGVELKTIPPEDLLVIKAIIHDEEPPRHWNDAIAILASCNVDWDYLLRRARSGPRRVLSLLLYAQSSDVAVPNAPVKELFSLVFENGEIDGRNG